MTPTGYHGSVNSSVDASSSDAVIDGEFAVTGVVNVDVAVVIGVTQTVTDSSIHAPFKIFGIVRNHVVELGGVFTTVASTDEAAASAPVDSALGPVWAASDTAVASISAAATAESESENELVSSALDEELIYSYTYRQLYLINSW